MPSTGRISRLLESQLISLQQLSKTSPARPRFGVVVVVDLIDPSYRRRRTLHSLHQGSSSSSSFSFPPPRGHNTQAAYPYNNNIYHHQHHQPTLLRPFTSSTTFLKKGSKSSSSSKSKPFSDNTDHGSSSSSSSSSPPTTTVPDNAAQKKRDAEIDPYDYSELEGGIARALDRLKDALAKGRGAGRLSPEMIEALPVTVKTEGGAAAGGGGGGGTTGKETLRLGSLATVVPKGGRAMQVFVNEEVHLKPVTSAIVSSPYSITATTPDPHNPLQLLVPVPPATAESRQAAVAEAKKSMDKAAQAVRDARGDAQKRFRKMELGKKVIRDELRKAHDGMEKVADRGQKEVKSLFDAAVKALER